MHTAGNQSIGKFRNTVVAEDVAAATRGRQWLRQNSAWLWIRRACSERGGRRGAGFPSHGAHIHRLSPGLDNAEAVLKTNRTAKDESRVLTKREACGRLHLHEELRAGGGRRACGELE